MAKKKPINGVKTMPDPEPVAQEAAPVVAVAESSPVLSEFMVEHPDPLTEVPIPSVHAIALVPYGDGQWAAARHGDRDLMVWVGGVRYEHVAETPDGRWVYAKS